MRISYRRMVRVILMLAMVFVSAASFGQTAAQGPETDRGRFHPVKYEITLRNLTGGQPLTPPLLATHQRSTQLFDPGEAATDALKEIAENGNLAPMLDALANDPHVFDVVVAPEPLVPDNTPGANTFDDSVTLIIEASPRARYLSFVSMLICTNDGFTGLNTVRLPFAVDQVATFHGDSYDAGTEINTEDFADMVPPCQGLIGVSSEDEGTGESDPALAENGVIHPHLGIQGGVDLLPDVHGWEDPVVEVTVRRLPKRPTYQVTIENLTSGQPLTPPVVATHRWTTNVFSVGQEASEGIQQVAENGNLTPLLDALAADSAVFDVFAGAEPLAPDGTPGAATFGDSVTFTIGANRRASFISFASMLICTNDGFAGLDTIALPTSVGETKIAYALGYDAGTEINTEDFADMVPPCQGLIGVSSDDEGTGESDPTLAEGGVIHLHEGIQGGNNLLPAVHGWDEPAVKVTLTRID